MVTALGRARRKCGEAAEDSKLPAGRARARANTIVNVQDLLEETKKGCRTERNRKKKKVAQEIRARVRRDEEYSLCVRASKLKAWGSAIEIESAIF